MEPKTALHQKMHEPANGKTKKLFNGTLQQNRCSER